MSGQAIIRSVTLTFGRLIWPQQTLDTFGVPRPIKAIDRTFVRDSYPKAILAINPHALSTSNFSKELRARGYGDEQIDESYRLLMEIAGMNGWTRIGLVSLLLNAVCVVGYLAGAFGNLQILFMLGASGLFMLTYGAFDRWALWQYEYRRGRSGQG